MPVGFRLKKSLNTKPKFSSGRAKETLGRVSSPDRRRHGSRETPRGRRSEYESDDIDSEPYRRVRSPGRNSDSAVKSKHHRLVRERNGGEADSKGSFRSGLAQRTRRADDVRAPSRKSSFVDGKHTRKNGSAARRGEFSEVGLSRRNHGFAKQRNFEKDESNAETGSGGEARPLRGHRVRNGDNRDDNDSDTKGSFRSELAQRTRRADDDRDAGEEGKSLRVRAPSRKSSFVDGKHTRKGVSAARRGEHSVVGISRRNHGYAKQRNFAEDESDAKMGSGGEARPLRGHRGRMGDDRDGKERMGDNRDGKGSDRRERRGANVEVLADKLRSKGRRRDGFISADECKGDAQVNYQKKMGNELVRTVFEDHQELKRYQARLLEKSGKRNVEPAATDAPPNKRKRIDSRKKSSDVEPAATDAPPKKRKRIKLDPYDTSNKRLDDAVPDNDHVEKSIEKEDQEIKISMNAQFRSIQPSPSILSFVEDNLLGRRRLIELQNAGYNIKLSAPLDNIPFSTSTERDRIEENVFRNKLEFFAAAKISSSFPPPTIPEIAFAGRSNVGKSSLLNALTRQWGVVRTSEKPGYTQTINFFRLASKLCLVDLPGYGFAYAKEEVKDAWEELVKEYVSTRVGLQRVCLLIDTKWGMKPRDHELIDLMERSETPYQIVLTKTDSVFPIDVARRAMQIEESMKINKSIVNPVMMLSSKSGAGVRSLRTVLAKLARFVKP